MRACFLGSIDDGTSATKEELTRTERMGCLLLAAKYIILYNLGIMIFII